MKRTAQVLRQATVTIGEFNTVGRNVRQGGVDYQVYPCVLLVEGVHHGAIGPAVYYPSTTLANSAPFWNNMPVTVGHPVNEQGNHILCNQDGTIRAQWEVGKVYNAKFEDGRLKAEVWINVAQVNRHSPSLLAFLQNGGQLDVSTGLLAAEDGTAGTWNEEEFAASILEIVPDHLALLPNQTGACSWNDGCGIRFNVAEKEKDVPGLYVNSQDLMVLSDKIRGYVDSLDVWDRTTERSVIINFLRAIYSDYFIYKQKVRRPNQQETEQLLKQEYAVGEDGELTFSSSPIEVIEEIQYKPKANEHETTIVNKKDTEEVNTMPAQGTKCKDATTPADKKKCADMMVNALISNEKTAFVEEDRPWLTAMNSAQLEKLVANMGPEEEVIVNKENTPTPKTETPTQVPLDLAGFLNSAPPEIRSVLNAGLRELDGKRASIITVLMANKANKFTEDQLKNMELNVLESIVALIPVPQDFSGRSPALQVNQETAEEPYIPATLSFGTQK